MLSEPRSIRWDALEPGRYEHAVGVLLSIENPDVRRVDGSGGDEGCDVAFPTPEGLVIYELKSWTGRVSKARWRQLGTSLNRATGREPVRWIVVCPIDLTPAEFRRFESLTSGTGFAADFCGRTWLDARMAEHPELVRYLSSSHDEVVNLLKQFGQEQATLAGGISDAVDRLTPLAAQLDELDPFHRWTLSIGEGNVLVSPQPRYLGADDDSPPRIVVQLSFPATPAGREAQERFERAVDHGERVVVEDEYIKNVEFRNIPDSNDRAQHLVEIVLGGDEDWDEPAIVAVVDDLNLDELTDDTDVHAWLPIRFFQRRGGNRRLRVVARDASGALTVRVEIEEAVGVSVNLAFDPTGIIPAATAPARALLRALEPGRGITVRFDGADTTLKPLATPDQRAGLLDLADRVAELEASSSSPAATSRLRQTSPSTTPTSLTPSRCSKAAASQRSGSG